MHKKALFQGTFDPPTLGHLNLIHRALFVCDILYVGIAQNNAKNASSFSTEEKEALLRSITRDLSGVEVVSLSGLVIDFAKKHGITLLVRGLRNFCDFEYENQMAFANHMLAGIETVFFIADEKYARLSSTLIREIAFHGHRLKEFIPAEIEETVFERLKKT
jgi:pantetheine-phosphate adenylyltransferase